MSKPKLGIYWAASCGGCDIAILQIHEKILKVAEVFDLALWPCAADFKYEDVEAMEDESILITLFNGAIRNSEHEHVAKLLRRKTKILVAYGSCAHEGCIPALANLTTKKAIYETVYGANPSVDNPNRVLPQTSIDMPEGELNLPEFYEDVKALDQVVEVDYYIPGCPPQEHSTWGAIEAVLAIMSGEIEAPPKGTVLGVNDKAVCDDCPREKNERRIKKFVRWHEVEPDPDLCLMEQGIICAGPATRGGCEAPCPQAGLPCIGCYGPPPSVIDQGAKLLSAVASVIDSTDEDEIEQIVDDIVDPAGTFYRFSLAHSLLFKRKSETGDGKPVMEETGHEAG